MNLARNSTTNGAWRTWKNCKAIQCVIAPFQAKVRKTGNTVTSAAFLRRLNASRRCLFEARNRLFITRTSFLLVRNRLASQ